MTHTCIVPVGEHTHYDRLQRDPADTHRPAPRLPLFLEQQRSRQVLLEGALLLTSVHRRLHNRAKQPLVGGTYPHTKLKTGFVTVSAGCILF